MNSADAALCRDLLTGRRWAALATAGEGGPLATMVAYAVAPDLRALYLHLSHLAPHTANLVDSGRASLVISAPDDGGDDPQTLPRLTISGSVAVLRSTDPGFADAGACYLQRLPAAEARFGFGDFQLFTVNVEKVNFVGGFARAWTLDGERFARELADRMARR